MKTAIKGPPTVFIDLLGIFSVSATSRRIHAFGGLGADTTILTISRRINKSGSLYFSESDFFLPAEKG